ncbi:Uncharacterized protein dnm_026180 [Desulfonema magnum]|uniref:Uncharacterized protein n=1 Tax=Desulfonema magnum TaxID=45655 RepID=A0A975GME3_9BACT|nr:Uncharacterized protein dnm_026180 [Desulfonema magnum]
MTFSGKWWVSLRFTHPTTTPIPDIQKDGTDSPHEASVPKGRLKTARQFIADTDI